MNREIDANGGGNRHRGYFPRRFVSAVYEKDKLNKRIAEEKKKPADREQPKQWTATNVINVICALVTVAATVVIAVFTQRSVEVADQQRQILDRTDIAQKDSFVAATRAWIVPTGAKIDGSIELKVPLRIKVTFENIGKEVALDVLHHWGKSEEFEIPGDAAGIPFVDPEKILWPGIIECRNVPPHPAIVRSIYPGGKYEDIRYVFAGGPPEAFLKKKAGFWIAGCFAYKTFGEVRQSPYCLYWQPHRDRPIEQSTFEFCPRGGGKAN